MLHRNARRDFSVEIKSPGRRNATIIPTREPKPPRTKPKLLAPQSTDAAPEEPAHVKPAQTGRVLPNLIVPEPPPAPIEAEPEPKVRRPYTRRAKPAAAPVIEMPQPKVEPEVKPVPARVVARVIAPVPKAAAAASSDRKRGTGRDGVQQLALGERWKRRLSRWSR